MHLSADPVFERLALTKTVFRSELDDAALADIRLALHQGQPLGKGRFLDQIERMVGRRCEVHPRGRPAPSSGGSSAAGNDSVDEDMAASSSA